MSDERCKATISVYLLLEHEGKHLLALRQNTSYANNMWALVAGHGENNESAKMALCREVEEEIGLAIKPEDLEVVHIMHRQEGRQNVDFFMKCKAYAGQMNNCEPHKCGGLEFFSLDALPENTVPYVADALRLVKQGQFYSERGF